MTAAMPRLHSELTNLLPADFNRPIVLKTEKLDGYDLLDPKSKASKTVQKWLDDLPDGALLVWRPPRRPWVVIVPAGEVEGVEFEYGMAFGAWKIVGLGEWVEAWPPKPLL